jgi:flagellar basal-body rod protein FlgG
VGTIQLADFINPAGLQATGGNLFVESTSSGAPQVGVPGLNGLGLLRQGYIEGSNVNVVEELVSMIETQRAYEMNSRAVSTADQMLQFVTNNL